MSAPLEHLEGKYEILEKIREGGMGAVYKVRHRLLEEVRVIKLIRHQYQHDDEVKARFVREARTVIRLRHPNIAQLYDFSLDAESNAYIVMEYVEGLTLEDLQRKIGVAPVAFTLAVAAQALAALGYLHRKGIVHRDISPDNLMVARDDDGQPLVKLIDLGVAKTLKATTTFTQAGTFLGKVRYASPEQFRAQETESVDQRSDIYSFGVVLYEQLTGCHPIPASNMSALIAGHLFESPLPFSETDRDGRVPEDLRAVVLRALAKPPAERFQDAVTFAAALAAIAERFPLESGFLDFTFASGDVPTQRIEVAKPGSTQDRLDREFQLRTTPPPVSTPTPEEAGRANTLSLQSTPAPLEPAAPEQVAAPSPDAAAPPESASPPAATTQVPARASRPHDRVTALVADARVMLEIGQTDQARARLEEALQLEPDNREARRLLEETEATLHRLGQDRRQARQLADAQALVEACLERGDLAGAAHALELAERVLPDEPAFLALRHRVESGRRSEHDRRVAALLDEARAVAAAGKIERAIKLLDEDSGVAQHPEVLRLKDDLHRRTAVATIEASLRRGRLAEARRALAVAEKLYPGEPIFVALRQRLAGKDDTG